MELLGLAIVAAIIAMWYGVFGMLETGARMGNRRIEQYEDEQIQDIVAANVESKVSDADFEKALSDLKRAKSLRTQI